MKKDKVLKLFFRKMKGKDLRVKERLFFLLATRERRTGHYPLLC
jgi:hypothetical protein